MRILLTGKNGQLGWELRQSLARIGDVTAVDRSRLDLSKPSQAAAFVRETQPQIIVNAAAYTAVDPAEADEPLAHAVNALAPAAMAEEAARIGALFVHYSTDYVFDGLATSPYRETDPVAPDSAYGRSKEEGERLIRASGAHHLILRTAWVYGARGHNFLLTMLRLARQRDRLRVVADQIGSPTWSRSLAEASTALIASLGTVAVHDTYHLSSQGSTSWHGFASAIVEQGSALDLCPAIPVDAIGTADYPTPAHRPAYSVLSGEKLLANHRIALPDWRQSLSACLAERDRFPRA